MKNQRENKPIQASRAAEIRRLMEMAENTPNVRREKIEAISKQIEQGTYKVSGRVVAKSIADLWRCLNLGEHGEES